MTALFLLLGLVFGSFGSVLITRVPGGENIGGRSRCPDCKKTLRPAELIPVISYLFLRGRCRRCRSPIGLLYPSLELASGGLFVLAWQMHAAVISSLLLGFALWLLLLIVIIDARTQTISDFLNIPFLILALAYGASIPPMPLDGAILGVAFFGVQWAISRGRWIGSGDIILAGGIGALLGDWTQMAACLFLTYIIGGMTAGILLLTKRIRRGDHIAFGPFLAAGTLAALLLRARIDTFFFVYFGI